jgi:hypothetical protein
MYIHQPQMDITKSLEFSIRRLKPHRLEMIKEMIQERQGELARTEEIKDNIRARVNIVIREMSQISDILHHENCPDEIKNWFTKFYPFEDDFESLEWVWHNFKEGLKDD